MQTKQAFMHGKGHSLLAGEFDKLQAILSFDQAIELFLYTVITELAGDSNDSDNSFNKLWDKANSYTQKHREKIDMQGLPLRPEIIGSVHKLRNNAQHQGHIPSENDLLRATDYTEEFLRKSFVICFGKSFERIFLADAILYEDIRQVFREAEEALGKNDLEGTIIGLAKCFAFLQPHMTKKLPWDDTVERMISSYSYMGSPYMDSDAPVVAMIKYNDECLRHGMIEIAKYVDSKINILATGGNLQDYKLFLEKAPTVGISQGGNIIGVHLKHSAITEEECIRMFNFIYNMVIHCQSFE